MHITCCLPIILSLSVDLTHVQPDTPHSLVASLPATLQPGQFQGSFLENVEAPCTSELRQ